MTTNMNRLVPVTDERGKMLLGEFENEEPLPGSIVMADGEFGTAWQRHFSDGLWHRAGSNTGREWSYILGKRNVVLVYDAKMREVKK